LHYCAAHKIHHAAKLTKASVLVFGNPRRRTEYLQQPRYGRLFDAPKAFPVEVLHFAVRLMTMKVRNTEARYGIEDIPSGTYALIVLMRT
jgi:hypothetical protein